MCLIICIYLYSYVSRLWKLIRSKWLLVAKGALETAARVPCVATGRSRMGHLGATKALETASQVPLGALALENAARVPLQRGWMLGNGV